MQYFIGFCAGVAVCLVIGAIGEGNRKKRFLKWKRGNDSVPFGESVPSLGFSVEDWRKSYYNEEIDPKTNEPYGYRIKTDDGSVFGSKINAERIKNGLSPI